MIIKYIFILCLGIFLGTSMVGSDIDFARQIKDIQIVGLLNPQVRDVYKVRKDEWFSTLQSSIGSRVVAAELSHDINMLYLTGYFQFISASTVPSGNGIILQFDVIENPVIDDIVFTGNTQYHADQLSALMSNRSDRVLNVKHLQGDVDALTDFYYSHGYDLFQVQHMDLNEKNQLHIGTIEGQIHTIDFRGYDTIQPFVLYREIESTPGGVFNSQQLRHDRERLLRLGYFSDVSPPILEENTDKTKVNIVYEVKEKKNNRIDLGFEIDQFDQELVAFFRNDVNHTFIHSDFLSGKIQSSFTQGNVEIRSYSFHYSQPWLFNRFNTSLDTNLWLRFQDERLSDRDIPDLIENRRLGGDVRLGFPLIRDRLRFTSKFRAEYITLPDGAPEGIDIEPYTVQSLAGNLSFSDVKNPFDPRQGSYWAIEFEQGLDLRLFGKEGLEFSKLSLEYAIFYSLSDNDVLAFHIEGGSFNSPNQVAAPLTFEQEVFEIGGANSLRGRKEDRSLRGSREILMNVEYRHDLYQWLQGVVFFDAGQVFDRGEDLDSFDTSAGVGLRFSTPVGPLRFDYAFGHQQILHFSLGQLF